MSVTHGPLGFASCEAAESAGPSLTPLCWDAGGDCWVQDFEGASD